MQFKQVDEDYFIYVEKNEKLVGSLTNFCIEQGLKNAKISGIGAVKMTEIGAYDTIAKKYIKKQFSDTMELVSFEGNVTLKDRVPFLHAHVVLSNHDMNTFGGHLFETTVAAVGEFFVRNFKSNAYRELNEDIGLPCICLENKF
tara:strand:- start:396 stop:827 length:432 start_codon:yes stop_codon:yes gene_type:complete